MNRKEEIIYATLELASSCGMKGVSMSQIAEKVGIKAPSLYNHFKSKDDIIREMYGFLREKAKENSAQLPLDYKKFFERKSLEEILLSSLSSYVGIVSDRYMLQFFRVLYSERSTNPIAAQIMLEETERMLTQTRDLFYALAVHGKIIKENVDMAAMTYSFTVHSLIDYRMDKITAGQEQNFGDGKSPLPQKLIDYIKWFSSEMAVSNGQ